MTFSRFLFPLLVLPLAAAALEIRTDEIRFEPGKDRAKVEGSVTGGHVRDYRLVAKAGQKMTVRAKAGTPSLYFNVLAPEKDAAIFVGSRDGERFEGALPADGAYRVRVYLMGNARDTGAKVDYTLSVKITGEAASPSAGEEAEYTQSLSLQGIDFEVETRTGKDGKRQIVVTPSGLEIDNREQVAPIEGLVTAAEVADLNSDGSPEIYVYLREPGPEGRGRVVAWSTNRKKSMSDIYLAEPPADDPKMAGYAGRDEFAVVETVLARRFPIAGAKDGEPKTRQFQYKLIPGEASWQLVLDKVVEF